MDKLSQDLASLDLSALDAKKSYTLTTPVIALVQDKFDAEVSKLEAKFGELKSRLIEANPAEGESRTEAHLDYFKWLDFEYLLKLNEQTKKLAADIKAQGYTRAAVIGMGGSGINAMVLKNALSEFSPVIEGALEMDVQNNLDPSSWLAKLQRNNELDKTIFLLISKSGNTDEVRRNISTLINSLAAQSSTEEALKTIAKQSVIITEPVREGKNNFLHNFKNELKDKTGLEIPYLENDPNIGGRFSMFSPVGMLPAELMGLDSSALISGAQLAWQDLLDADKITDSTVATLATLDTVMSRNGIVNRYSMVYADALESLNKCRAQLKGESLNKDLIDSTVHIPGIGTVNHHSDLELLLKKNNGLVLEQVFFAKPAQDHNNADTGLEVLADLNDQSNHESLIANHIKPLNKYILENACPVLTSIIAEQSESAVAYYIMQDMLVTIVQAGLQDKAGEITKLDLAIRQWEVEKYKASLRK